IHAVIVLHNGRRRLGGRGWKHHMEYIRGTNVLRVLSRHATGLKVERRLAAISDWLCTAFRCEQEAEVGWERGLGELVPKAGVRATDKWPDEFDPPPLGGATRAWVVARVPDLADRAAITDLYARSVLVIAQHHDRSGALAVADGNDALVAHALDVCGERGAARDFFEWAVKSGRTDPQLAWALERHLHLSDSPTLRTRLEELKAPPALEPPPQPEPGTGGTLWAAWQDAL